MKKIRKNISLKAHLWLYFGTFAIIIMVMLWILQTLFLGAFYNGMKLNELEKVGNLISNQYDLNSEDFYDFWFEHSFNSGIFARLVTEDGESIPNFDNIPGGRYRNLIQGKAPISPNPSDNNDSKESNSEKVLEGIQHRDGKPMLPPDRRNRDFVFLDMDEVVSKIRSSTKGKVSYVVESEGKRGSYAVYGTYLGESEGKKVYLTLISPLERTDITRKVIQTQLIIASIAAILMGFAIAYFIARRFSKPIENMNKTALLLAKGNYDVEFLEGSYREVEELAGTLNYATKELSKTEELRRDLISNVSHDLRTPLTIIKSYAELIRDISGENPEKRTKHTEIIIEETNNLSLLVNDMLDLSKMQSGTMPMEKGEFVLVELVQQTLKRFAYYSENKGIIFETNFASEATVLGDERRIEQVIYNLVVNAVNYIGEDNRIIVSLSESKTGIRFSVRDNGCGIAQEELDHVWDKYYKASETHQREKIGTGIGLSIVKNILIAHDADFGVISEKGKGSEFWFELKKG